MKDSSSFDSLTDGDLIAEVKRLAADERRATAVLVAGLVEFDARRLYLGEGCRSLFTYCTGVLHLSEHAAYGRIEAVRAARRFPIVLDLLASGALTLTAVTLLAPRLTADNHRAVFEAARHKSKRELEQIVAALAPRPDVPAAIRRLPQAKAAPSAATAGLPLLAVGSAAGAVVASVPAAASSAVTEPATAPVIAAPARAAIAPLAPERFLIQFTVGRETHDKLRRAQDLSRHVIPRGDLAQIFDRALTLLIAQFEKRKNAATNKPSRRGQGPPKGRGIPAAVRRAVWQRDAGRCAFTGSAHRCHETGQLEYHHVIPFACGGAATVDNIELRCRAHNQYEGERMFGPRSLLVRERAPRYGVSLRALGPDRVILCHRTAV